MIIAKGQVIGGIAGVIGEAGGNGFDQLTYQVSIEMHTIPITNICARSAPIGDGNWVAKYYPHIFQNSHGSLVDLFNFLKVHWLGQRQLALECRQHGNIASLANDLARAASPACGAHSINHAATRRI